MPTIVYITHFRWARHIYTAWHFERCRKEAGGRQKKNTLQEDYAPSMPSLLQEFVMLHLVCKCRGDVKERGSAIVSECVCVCVWIFSGLPEFTPSL